jgi:hypothetical protein
VTIFPNYPGCPHDGSDDAAHRRQIARTANLAISGKANNKGEVTLAANAASTTVTDPRISYFSTIVFEPLTANAAAELYGGTMYVTEANHGKGSFVITHANDANADKTFRYIILG